MHPILFLFSGKNVIEIMNEVETMYILDDMHTFHRLIYL